MKSKKKNSVLIDSFRTWKRLLTFIPVNKLVYLLIILMYTSLGTFTSFLSGKLLKDLSTGISEGNIQHLILSIILYSVLMLSLSALSWLCFHVYVGNLKMKIEYKVTIEVFNMLLHKGALKDPEDHSGDSLTRLLFEGHEIPNVITWDLIFMVMPITNILFCGVITLFISWQIGVGMFTLGLLFLLITVRFSEPLQKINQKITESTSKVMQKTMDFLTGYPTLRLMGLEKPFYKNFEKETSKLKKLSLKNMIWSSLHSTIGNAVGLLSTITVVVLGILLIRANQLTIGNLLLLYQFATTTVNSIINIGDVYANFQRLAANLKRVFEIYDSEPEDSRSDMPNITESDILNNDSKPVLLIDHMSFRYRDDLDYALRDITLGIQKGEHIALVGESGSGKSTFFKLLLGLYSPTEGGIQIYGKDYMSLNLKSIRNQYSYVAQDCTLFDMSIKDNIGFGNIRATQDEIIYAAKQANAHEFISTFPHGYDEMVGELGNKVSGGQRQRIVIARAILKNLRILLLDEATSSLDSRNEKEIQETLNRNFKNVTMIVAAHRLSTIKDFNKIVVLDKGRIAEAGTHEELMEHKGIYYQLFSTQSALQQLKTVQG